MFQKLKVYFKGPQASSFLKTSVFFPKFFLRRKGGLKPLERRGFSLLELLTVIVIVGLLALFGYRSYNSSMNKTKSAEAKHILSYIYTAQENFKADWGAYHENLMAVGAIPSGKYRYDAGFKVAATGMSQTEGALGGYPKSSYLNLPACADFKRICSGDCATAIKAVDTAADKGKYTPSCEVSSGACAAANDPCIQHHSATDAIAAAATFKAYAIGKLRGKDVWSIDEEQSLVHVTDGL